MSNFLIRVTRNACISITLPKTDFQRPGENEHDEKIIDARESPPDAAPDTSGECAAERTKDQHSTPSRRPMRDRTGSHTPRRAIQLARSFRTTALVGIGERLDPTNPGSCNENSNDDSGGKSMK